MSASAAWARHAKTVLLVSILVALAAGLARETATDPRTRGDAGRLRHGELPGHPAGAEAFGEEPVVVLAEGDLQQLVLTSNWVACCGSRDASRAGFEGVEPIPGPCTELAARAPPRRALAAPPPSSRATIRYSAS